MTAKLLALRSMFVARKVVPAGDVFTCPDDVAAELLASGKVAAADAATRKRVNQRPLTQWTAPGKATA